MKTVTTAVILVTFISSVLCISIACFNRSEISLVEYRNVRQMSYKYSKVKTYVEECYSDEKISVYEYKQICALSGDVAKKKVMKDIKVILENEGPFYPWSKPEGGHVGD